jgi:SpoIID/LytB domain protein
MAFLIAAGCVPAAFTPAASTLSTPDARATASASAALIDHLRIGMLKPGGGYTVSSMPLETYVARVLAGEAARDSPPAALEALAITVRTFALANPGRHRADGFDLCDQTHCQVVRTATPASTRAALATAGRVLVNDAAIAPVFYSASCGGHTEVPSAVWPGADDPPYLPSHGDEACGGEPVWSAELASSELTRALHAAGFRGRLRDLRIASRNESGRVAKLLMAGLKPERISGQELRVAVGRTLGWQHIKSTAFEVHRKGTVYLFTGRGSGHGVGLCVIGSTRLAAEGRSAADILDWYFPGLTIAGSAPTTSRGPDPEVVVALPEGDEGERAGILKETVMFRDDLVRRLGVPAPRQIVLRFHATTDDYERASGQAWFTSAAIVNGEVHLLPLAVLRERGVLARTVRHELVHLLTDPVIGRRPMWVREGAAVYFADERRPDDAGRSRLKAESRASCPPDGELRLPASVGALSTAYARARACFARQIQSGRNWRDVQ